MSSTSKPEIVKTETTSLKTNYIIYQLHTYKNIAFPNLTNIKKL